jgi:hypothetical protein
MFGKRYGCLSYAGHIGGYRVHVLAFQAENDQQVI